jgi:SAM-dependent methyltransferase
MPIDFEHVLQDATTELAPAALRLPRLNLGSGRDRRDGFVNLDLVAMPAVDVAARLGEGLPFRPDTFGVVVCRDILEHVDVVPAMRDVHRVTAPGGLVIVSAVHFTSRNLYVDPTHIRGFSVRTLEFFAADDKGGEHSGAGGEGWRRPYYFDFSFRRVGFAAIQFGTTLGNGRFLVWDRFVEPCVNARRITQDFYEMTGLSRIFPAANVVAVLQK